MDNITLVLASKSPRRQTLIKELGFPVEIRIKEVDEIYPSSLNPKDVPAFLSELKAEPLIHSIGPKEILITSDTIVLLENEVIGKPSDEKHAKELLRKLSGQKHTVVTGVTLTSMVKSHTFSSSTDVYFNDLSNAEIDYYVDQFKPLDKAGAYGIQEWIGYIGVRKIDGCYYNVMGLPLHDLYHALKSEFFITLH